MKLTKSEKNRKKAFLANDIKRFHDVVDQMAAKVKKPEQGFFGPDSITWKLSTEPALLAMGMRPLLLQVAHPKVGQAVADHSKYRTEPLARGFRTFDAVYKIVFGDVATALEVAKKTFVAHTYVIGKLDEPIKGMTRQYYANDPELAMWIFATLIDSAVLAYQTFIGPLTASELEQYYEEAKVFARLFAVTEACLPKTWLEFQSYMQRMLNGGTLQVTPVARDVGQALMYGAPTWVRIPMEVYNVIGGQYLPDQLRQDFGMHFNSVDRVLAPTAEKGISLVMRGLPGQVRALPAARAAQRRLGTANRIMSKVDRTLVRTVQTVMNSVRIDAA